MKLGMYKRKNHLRMPSEPPETLGEAMLRERLRQRMTQADMAELLGTWQNRVSEYESNKRTPSKRTLRKFIKELSLWPWSGELWQLYNEAYKKADYNKKNKLDSLS